MDNNSKIILVVSILAIIVIGALLYIWNKPIQITTNETNTNTEENTATNNENTSNQITQSDGLNHFADAAKTIRFDFSPIFTFTDGGTTLGMGWRQNAKQSGILHATLVLPQTFMPGTNFADAKLTIGSSSDQNAVSTCGSVDKENGEKGAVESHVGAVPFLKFNFTGAAAGNLYETTSYRAIVNTKCYAIEYTIHSGNIANYPPESGIKQFDKAKIVKEIEKVVQSILFLGKDK